MISLTNLIRTYLSRGDLEKFFARVQNQGDIGADGITSILQQYGKDGSITIPSVCINSMP